MTPDIGRRTSDGAKSKNNISTPQGGGHNEEKAAETSVYMHLVGGKYGLFHVVTLDTFKVTSPSINQWNGPPTVPALILTISYIRLPLIFYRQYIIQIKTHSDKTGSDKTGSITQVLFWSNET